MRRAFVLTLALVSLFSASDAHAFLLKMTSQGEAIRWGAHPIDIELAVHDGPDGIDPTLASGAVQNAFGVWASALPEDMPVNVRPMAGAVPDPSARDRQNLVRWIREGWEDDYEPEALAVTLTTYDPETGRITDADILINADKYQWHTGDDMADCRGAYDLQNVLTHEIGHFLGLAHEKTQTEATMFPSSAFCETKKRDLHEDDVAGVVHLYEEIGPAPDSTNPFACAVTVADGQRLAPLGAGLLFLLSAFTLGRRRIAAIVAAGLLLGASEMAQATTARRLDNSELARTATLVVLGKVASVRPVDDEGRVYTDIVIDTSECWKGDCGTIVQVRQLGGEVEGRGVTVEGSATFAEGQEVVLFLRARRDGAFSPLGMAQGVFTVERGPDGLPSKLHRDTTGLTFVAADGSGSEGGKESIDYIAFREALRVR